MLATYPGPWPSHPLPPPEDDVAQYQFYFHHQQKQPQQPQQQHLHPVPAPARPLIPDDNDAFAFSRYIVHHPREEDQPPQLSPSPSTPPLSSASSGPFSAITPTSSFSLVPPPAIASSYTELRGLETYLAGPSKPPPAPVATPVPRPIAPAPASLTPPVKLEPKRPSGACTRCKKMKMKCEFRAAAAAACQRCMSGKFECVVEGRKPRTPSQREWLLSQIRQCDAQIVGLLKAHRPADATPLTLAASRLELAPPERAQHRDALAWAEKGGPVGGAGVARYYTVRLRERQREREREGRAEDDDDDDEWSSDESEPSEDDAVRMPEGVERMHAHALPERRAPLGIIARMSLEDARARGTKRARSEEGGGEEAQAEAEAEDAWGVANRAYFQPGPAGNMSLRRVLNERESPPAIVASGLVSWAEAETLFDIFYECLNPYVSLLDPVLHTVSSVFQRCPFLFTVVCAISSRFLPSRPGLHKIAMHFAKTCAATAFVDGTKSVELVQAYFLMSIYGLPARRWEEDRSWFYGGIASRIATDLSLNRATGTAPVSERHERELLNRARTWLICFNMDRSSSMQWGKPTSLSEDEAVKGAKEWYRRSKYNHAYDVHLVAYTELLRIVSRFHSQVYSDPRTPTGLNKHCNFRAITEATEAEMRNWHDETEWKYANESDPNDRGCVFRTKGVPVFENYMRLVMYSFGFQAAWKRHGLEPGDMFFAKCLQSASAVVKHLIDVHAPSGYLKYAPDCFFVMGGFCSAFLLKMLRPEFATLLDEEQRVRIVALVGRFVDVLASPAAAIDETHTPKLYAKFLHGQLRHIAAAAAASAPPSPVPPHASAHARVPDGAGAPQTPGETSSSAASSVPTPGPDQDQGQGQDRDAAARGWPDSWTEGSGGSGSGSATAAVGAGAGGRADDPMELCEDDFLATMQAVSNEQWLSSVLMPGFKWPTEEQQQQQQQQQQLMHDRFDSFSSQVV